ncbi:MAG: hypothetical protein WDW36_002805 [Sanguina aurantia]
MPFGRGQQSGLQLGFPSWDAVVRTDFSLLRRVLQNFLSNAIGYTERGKVLLGVRRIRGGLRVEVWDTGIGIAANNLDEIFEEFHRLDTHRARTEPGAGLGLAIVSTIARLLDLRIGVRSWPGRGSAFSIDVPQGAGARQMAPGAHATTAESAAMPTGSRSHPAHFDTSAPVDGVAAVTDAAGLLGRRVWCVEDDRDVREAMGSLLHGWGCAATVFASLDDCLTAARESTVAPELLLLDFRIGDRLGTELPPLLATVWHRHIPALLISGDHELLRDMALVGITGPVLIKPIQPDILRARLLELLAGDDTDTGTA